ncbi:MAG TPA: DUF1634 domain-containing protein [Terriglobales bacterium]|nr:DUF1634 domain-containing protein [Terriglobales bacterium]
MKPGTWSDEQLETIMGNLLRIGVLTAAAVVLIGAGLFLAQHGRAHPDYHRFQSEPAELKSLPGIGAEVASGHSQGIIQLGLILLIATPIMRVIFAVIGFGFERDYLYTVVSLIVLAVLLYSLLGHAM